MVVFWVPFGVLAVVACALLSLSWGLRACVCHWAFLAAAIPEAAIAGAGCRLCRSRKSIMGVTHLPESYRLSGRPWFMSGELVPDLLTLIACLVLYPMSFPGNCLPGSAVPPARRLLSTTRNLQNGNPSKIYKTKNVKRGKQQDRAQVLADDPQRAHRSPQQRADSLQLLQVDRRPLPVR